MFRFVIPVVTFSDAEDGNTASLHLELLTEDGKQLEEFSWNLDAHLIESKKNVDLKMIYFRKSTDYL